MIRPSSPALAVSLRAVRRRELKYLMIENDVRNEVGLEFKDVPVQVQFEQIKVLVDGILEQGL